MLVFGFYAVGISQRALHRSIGESAVALSTGVLQNIDLEMRNKIEVFEEYAMDLILQEAVIASNWEFDLLDDPSGFIDERDAEWRSVPKDVMTPFMSGLIETKLSYDLREKIDYYERKYGYRVFGEVFVTNSYGANIAQTGKTTDYRQNDEQWWQMARESGRYIEDVSFDESSSVVSTDAGIKIVDDEGNFLGVMKVVLNIENTIAVLKKADEAGRYASMEYSLLTRNGEVIYTTQEKHDPMKYVNQEFLDRFNDESGYFAMGTQKDDYYEMAYGDGVVIPLMGVDFYDSETLVVYARSGGLTDSAKLGWILVIEYDTAEVFAPVRSLKNFISMMLAFAIFVAAIMGLVLYRAISKPVQKLCEAAAVLGEGDYDTRIEIDTRDEIGELAAAFNLMGERLKDAMQGRDAEIQERKISEKKVRHMAYHDHLTGLPNRKLFIDRLEQAMQRLLWHKRLASVLFLDLDRFKVINDTLGHAAGDKLLKIVGERFSGCLREGDSVARFGGDEFCILLQDIARVEDIPIVVEKIFAALKEPIMLDNEEISVSTSIGVSVFPNDGRTADLLLKNADIAMYRAKADGRNNYHIYTESLASQADERMRMERRIAKAIEHDELVLHYQPLLSVEDGAVVGSEALLRMRDGDLGLVPPMKFIPLAEETGQIIAMSEWVLDVACKQNKKWQDMGLNPQSVAVNISARMFKQKDFVGMVSATLERTGLDPEYLELEITESVIMTDADDSIKKMYELKSLGVRLSIDDFGTGYSSLNYLKHMPIDMLKIDRSFVRDLATDVDVKSIVMAIVKMGQSIGVEVLAEGVEDEAQLAYLTLLKCDKLQGYLFSKPVDAKQYTQLLKEKQPFIIRKKAS
jgi:diguanylate cyclase (GGDEF)-like protein